MSHSSPHKSKAWFLGPKAENQGHLETLLLEAFRDYCYWRRHFHPEDQGYIRGQDRLSHDFMQFQEDLHDHLFELLSRLKQSMPFFSPRYLGHMCKDLLSPGVLGYFASLFYNQNNITQEAATTTLLLEIEAIQTLAEMLGYDNQRAWGHLCSGGTAANIEALWVARNVRLFPWQVALAMAEAPDSLKGAFFEMLEAQRLTHLYERPKSVTVAESLALYQGLEASDKQVLYAHAERFSVTQLGMHDFLQAVGQHFGQAPRLRVAYSHNAHYSLKKSLNILGLGEQAAFKLPLTSQLSMDTSALRAALLEDGGALRDDVLLAVVGVYGSTEEGAIDDIHDLVALKSESEAAGQGGFWLHGDACYGGYALSMLRHPQKRVQTASELVRYLQSTGGSPWDEDQCQHWLERSEAMASTDSISLDPHKLGYLPYPAGTVLYRDYAARGLVQCSAPYINARDQAPTSQWHTPYPGKFTLEGSRPGATSAAVWLTHKTIPLDQSGHGQIIAGTLAGCAYLQSMLARRIPQLLPGMTLRFLPRQPDLNILCYSFSGTWKDQPVTIAQSNALVHRIYQEFIAQSPESEDFIVSMTSLSRAEYGDQALNALWGETVFVNGAGDNGSESDSVQAVQQVALLRTVVMDPFLVAAETRHPSGGTRNMVAYFIDVLARRLAVHLDILQRETHGGEPLYANGGTSQVERAVNS